MGAASTAFLAPESMTRNVLDGANLTDDRDQSGVSASGSMLGVEEIREFRTISQAFSAEYGMTMGASQPQADGSIREYVSPASSSFFRVPG
jgi:hypothetical protein